MPVARYNTGATYGTPGLVYGPASTPPATGAKKMKQNIAALNLDAPKLTAIDAAITALETELDSILLDLTPLQISRLAKMGDGNEAFCRDALTVMTENTGILPGNFDLTELQADWDDLDALRPRALRVQQLLEKINDTVIGIGSDIMVSSLEGYALVKIAGFGEGLDLARRQLGARFAKTTPPATPTPAPTP